MVASATNVDFAARCRALSARLDDGHQMSLGEMAEFLGLPWNSFAAALAAQAAEQVPGAVVMVELVEPEVVH